MLAPSTRPSELINELELLHAGLGVLMAHYLACHDDAVRPCLALRISRQVRIIAEHRDLAGPGLAAPLPDHGGALAGACDPWLPCPSRVPHQTIEENLWEEAL